MNRSHNHERIDQAPSFIDEVRHLVPELTPEERSELRNGLLDEIMEYKRVIELLNTYEELG